MPDTKGQIVFGLLMWGPGVVRFIGTESRRVVRGAGGGKEGPLVFHGGRVAVSQDAESSGDGWW